MQTMTEVARTSFTHEMSQDPTTISSLGTRWFQEKATHVKLEGSHQQGSQEDRDRMGRGTGGSGGQLVHNDANALCFSRMVKFVSPDRDQILNPNKDCS